MSAVLLATTPVASTLAPTSRMFQFKWLLEVASKLAPTTNSFLKPTRSYAGARTSTMAPKLSWSK